MASAVGNLVVRLSAQTQRFQRGMAGARGTLNRFASGIGGLIRRVGGLGMALAGIGGAAGMALMVRSSFKSIDAAAKLSDQIGITTEKLVGLRHAAEITGTGGAKLDAALQVMQKRLGEVALKGTGAAAPALEAIGLSAKELIRLSPDEQFRAIADAMGGLSTQSERNAVTANIFSRANQALVNTLALGSKGLDEMQSEAERLGLTFSRVEAAKIEEANDAITRMKSAIGAVANTLAIALAPTVQKVAEWFVSITPKIQETAETIGFAFRHFGAVAQIALIDVVQAGINAFPMLEPVIEKGATVFVAAWAGVKAFFMDSIQAMKGGLQELAQLTEALWEGIKALPGQIIKGPTFDEMRQDLIDQLPAGPQREEAERRMRAKRAAGEFKETPTFMDAFTKTLAEQQDVKAPNALKSFTDAYGKAFDEMDRKFKEGGGLSKMLDDQKKALLDSIAAQEAARVEADRRRQMPIPVPEFDLAIPEEGAGPADRKGSEEVAAVRQKTQEAWHAIQQAMDQKEGGPEKRAQKTREQMLTEQKKLVGKADEQLELARNVELMDIGQ